MNSAGMPASGHKINTYAAGSSTPLATYTTADGDVAQANPIVLNSNGLPDNEIWVQAGLTYKYVWTDENDVVIDTFDNISGINDTSTSASQWQASGVTPTYVSGTSFTLPGDQTSEFHVGRRVQCTVSAGTVYGVIASAAYTTLTTVTVVLDGGSLDSGLSSINLSLLRADHPATPIIASANIASAATLGLYTLKGQVAHITGTTTTTAVTMAAGQWVECIADAAWPLTYHATNLKLNTGGVDYTCSAGDRIFFLYDGTTVYANIVRNNGMAVSTTPPRSYIAALTMSTAGSSSTMSIAAGQAADSTNAVLMALASSISKTTSAWAVGTSNGALDTGTIAANTWYHFYLIQRSDTGVVDVLFSLSATAPTLPANYTYARRIGSGRTNASNQWTAFVQIGDKFLWTSAPLDIATSSFAASSQLYTMTVPLGVKTTGLFQGHQVEGTAGYTNFWDPALGIIGVSGTASPLYVFGTDSATGGSSSQFEAGTNTSSQIYGSSTALTTVRVVTRGWIDARGKND